MTALTIIQGVCSRLALPAPGAVFSSTETQVIQLRNLMNQEGKELAKRHQWTKLIKETSFTAVNQAVQTDAVPSDFAFLINDSMWDRTTDRPVIGPLNAQEWQQEKAGPTFTNVVYGFRFRGDDLLLTPDPTAGDTIYFEYVSKNWAEANDGTGKAAMTADTDVGVLDEELITLGIVWRFLMAKGFDYAEAFRTYQMEVDKAVARDGGAPVLNLGRGYTFRRLYPNIIEGNWPG